MTRSNGFDRRRFLANVTVSALALGQARTAWAAGGKLAPLVDYGRLPAYARLALSPDGRQVAFVGDSAKGRVLCHMSVETEEIGALNIGKDPLTYLMWADNYRTFSVTTSLKPVGPESMILSQGGFIDIRDGHSIQVFAGPGLIHPDATPNYQRVRINGDARLSVPHHYYGHELSRMSTGDGLFSYSLASGRSFDMDVDTTGIQNWVVRPDGSIAARSEYDEDTKLWKIKYKGDTGWREIYSLREEVDPPVLCGLGRDSQSLLIRFMAGDKSDGYYEINPHGVLSAPFDLAAFDYYPLFSNQTFALAGFISTRTIETSVMFDAQMQKLPTLVSRALPGRRNYLVDYADDPRQLIVRSESDDDAGTYYYFDFVKGSYNEVGSPYPDLDGDTIGQQSIFTYTAQDGLEISAFLTLPPGSIGSKLPVVVLPHGGFGSYESEGFDWLAQAIASRGYAVVQPNYRGSGGQGRDFLSRGFGEMGGKILSDLSDAVAHLAAKGTVDAGRSAIAGFGMGGYLALASVSVTQGAYRCAVSVGGLTDIKAYMQWQREEYNFDDKRSGFVAIRRWFGDAHTWPAQSPLNQVERINCPVLLVHGEYDVDIFPKHSRDLQQAMLKGGKSVDYIVLKQEDSSLINAAPRQQTLQAIVDYLLKHNPAT